MKQELKLYYKRSDKSGVTTAISIKPNIFQSDNAGRDMNDYGRITVTETYKDSSGKTKRVDANLLFSEAKAIARRVHEADRDFLFADHSGDGGVDRNRPAFTTQVKLRPCSGMSPGQYLSEHMDDASVQALKDCGNLLRENINKDPNGKYADANKKQVAAIRDALNLLESGQLKPSATSSSVVLLETPTRNKTTTNKNGKNLVYNVKITYLRETGMIDITLENRYAQIIRHEGRGQTFDMQNAEDYTKLSFTMDMLQACEFFDAAADYVSMFENKIFNWVYDKVKAEETREREEWKKNRS